MGGAEIPSWVTGTCLEGVSNGMPFGIDSPKSTRD